MTDGVPGPGDDLPQRGAAVVRVATDLVPVAAVLLGSGLGSALGDALHEAASFPYTDLPGFPPAAVPGHAGRLTLGTLAGVPVAAFSGRVHYYEGHGMDVPALLPRLAHELGARTIVLTAAVGGLEPGMDAGTVVILTDHVNLMGAAPLRAWRFPDGMPAFVNTRAVYDPALAELTLARAQALGIRAVPGVYAAMSGPAYETPAEVGMLQRLGATVVGMSMVPESLPAHALGMRVLGVCSLTNALGDDVTHEEVLRLSNETAAAVGRLLVDLFPRLPAEGA
ncbi:MAG: purine-nucleoside phosphorylase [Actinomycetota bacterium]